MRRSSVVATIAGVALALGFAGVAAPVLAAAPATVSTTSLAFGNVHVGASLAKTVTVKLAPSYVLSDVLGTDNSSWSVTASPTCQSPGAQNCVVTQTFHPVVLGTQNRTMSLHVCQLGTTNCTFYSVKVSGTGTIPARFSPTAITFGTVPVGTTAYKPEKVTTDAGFYVNQVTTSDGIFAAAHFAPDCIRPGAVCAFDLRVHPTTTGTFAGTATIELCPADDVNPCVQTGLRLSGTAGSPASGAPASLAFGSVHIGRTLSKTIAIKVFTGNRIGSITPQPDGLPPEFSIANVAAGCEIDGPTTCTFDVVFTPGDTLARSTVIRALVCEGSSPHCKAFDTKATGTGVLPGTVSPTSLAFGSAKAGVMVTKSEIVTLDAGWQVVDSQFFGVHTDQFSTDAGPACAALAPATKCAFHAVFRPNRIGGNSPVNQLVHVCVAPDLTYCVDLKPVPVTATGTAPATVTPTSLAFGNVAVGHVLTKPFTVKPDAGWSLAGVGGSGGESSAGAFTAIPDDCASTGCVVRESFAPIQSGSDAATSIPMVCNEHIGLCLDLAGVKSTGLGVLTTTTTKLTASVRTGRVDHDETLTAAVNPAPTDGGTVTFLDGTATIDGCDAVEVFSGFAQCDWAPMRAGSHSLKAIYSGSIAFKGSTSAALSQTVAAP